ncbi:hypothetical protein [Streptomyces synnematoformans]|uniref:DUF4352 domain-containing protein n=1 Tax=Streptomyces synnematoformans TaxID=415721 RepID=A0ABN2XC02_9ACTN
MIRPARALLTTLTLAVLPLAGCSAADGSGGTQSTTTCKETMRDLVDEAAANPDAPTVTTTPAACEGFTDAELEDMAGDVVAEQLGDAFDDALETTDVDGETAGTDTSSGLKVGESYAYDDGFTVTVDSISEITEFGEWDERPEPGQTAFRVTVTFDNGTAAPVDLDDVFLEAEGATNGGAVEYFYVEAGSKEIAGRIDAGVTTTKTSDFVIDDAYGSKILITVSRLGEDTDWTVADPEWTGTITKAGQ